MQSGSKSVGGSFRSQPSLRPFASPPHHPTIPLHPFRAHIPDGTLEDLGARLNATADIVATYENSFAPEDESYGLRKEWMDDAVAYWRDGFDWRTVEKEINGFPNYTTTLSTRGHTFTVHFMALFSEKPDAVPVIMTHGWPGSVLEFLPLFKHLTTTYDPSALPVHLIAPSMVGFGFSSPPPRHDQFSNLDVADLFNQLMCGLGLEGYVAQGGDIGSHISRLLGEKYDACRAVHVNFLRAPKPDNFDLSTLDTLDKACVERMEYFRRYEYGYRDEHATKTATIGMVVESSPVAMLAWIGEKFLVWSDEDPPLDAILADVTLYWLTRTFPTSLYHYRNASGPHARPGTVPGQLMHKPVGYSQFPKEMMPTPIEWVKGVVNLVWSKRHEKGGHFAALERPTELWQDLVDFIDVVKRDGGLQALA